MEVNGTHPGAEDLARRLIELEASGRQSDQELTLAIDRILQRLRQDMSRLLGADGFSALEDRSVDLARRRYSFLPSRNGTHALDEFRAGLAEHDPRNAQHALRAVCANIITLLFTFLGEQFTKHLIHQSWPNLPEQPEGHEREIR